MLHGHRRIGAALAVIAVAGGGWLVIGPATAQGRPVGPPHAQQLVPITAAIEASGRPVGPVGEWRVARRGDGQYVLQFAEEVRLTVQSWDTPATVTARPTTKHTWIVDFVVGNEPTDTTFSFTAVPIVRGR